MRVGVLLVASLGFAVAADAQALMGQESRVAGVTVRGHADSLYLQFARMVRERGHEVLAADTGKRYIRFLIAEAQNEATDVTFAFRGDSARISVSAARAGTVALMLGVGVVRDFVDRERGRGVVPP